MRNRILSALMAAVLVGGVSATGAATSVLAARRAAPSTAPAQRAMWLWNRSDPAAVVDWARKNGVQEIFAYVAPDLATSADLPRLQELKRRADAAGIRLAALGGDAGWVFDPAAALAWLRTAMGTGLFHRAHIDVEPYALDAWSGDQPGTVRAFLELLGAMQAADPRPLEADVAFWYASVPADGGNLADEVLRRVDAVTVMSYRDFATGPNSIIDIGTDMLVRGAAAGKPVRLGVETGPLADCAYCTFYEEGRRYLAAALGNVDTAARGHATYSGIAVHHYASWTSLRR